MADRAEERALEAFPINIQRTLEGEWDLNEESRDIFIQSYHQAEKDVIEKACNVIRHKYGEYHYLRGDITEDLIRMFKQAMKDE